MGKIEGLEYKLCDDRKTIVIYGSPEQLIEVAELIHARVSKYVHRKNDCDLRIILETNLGDMIQYQKGEIDKFEFDRRTMNIQYNFMRHRLKIYADSHGEYGKESSLVLVYLMNDGGTEGGYRKIQATFKEALEVEV